MSTVQHMGQDLLRVFESFRHFRIRAFERGGERIVTALSSLIDIGYISRLRGQNDLSGVLEIDLDDLVRKPEHYRVPCPHPLLNVDQRLRCGLTISDIGLNVSLKVASEMLEKRNFLLKFLGVVRKRIPCAGLVPIGAMPLKITEPVSTRIQNDFRRVVVVHPCRSACQYIP
jgi:hypothetical protein